MKNKKILLFDVDNTLTPPRQRIKDNMIETLKIVKEKGFYIGFVSGSDLCKQEEQIGKKNFHLFDYMFPENGLIAYKDNEKIYEKSVLDHFGEEKLQNFLNIILLELSKIKLPKKRGTFIEFRTGLINISPIGRNANQIERDEFEEYDNKHKIRDKLSKFILENFKELNLQISVGGQISIDIFPKGWDKTYCLKHLKDFEEIHFFGDKTYEGGNDYEIFIDDKTIGHSVRSYEETIDKIKELF